MASLKEKKNLAQNTVILYFLFYEKLMSYMYLNIMQYYVQ